LCFLYNPILHFPFSILHFPFSILPMFLFIYAIGLLFSIPGEHSVAGCKAEGKWHCDNGVIQFQSKAPLEVIVAKSKKMQGILDLSNGGFAWSVDVQSFQGFNGQMQREHFNENYVESDLYPKATFVGKIIESVDFSQNGVYAIRAKGKLNIHGVAQERIIKCNLEIKDNKAHVTANFSIKLADHNISIPKIVYQKIAEEIYVTVDATLK
jgi:YceI-like domain